MEMLTGNGKPTRNTKGLKGQFYKDLDTGDIYECELSSEFSTLHHSPVGGYLWKLRVDGNGDDVVKDGGVVRSVNGVLPDAEGNIVSPHILNIELHDNTCYPGGQVLCYTHTAKDLVSMFRNPHIRRPMLTRRVSSMITDAIVPYVRLRWYATVRIEGGFAVRLHFGNEYADIIANEVDNTITLDPDWVAPTSGGGSTTYEVLESRLRHYTVGSEPGEPVTMEEFKAAVANGAIYVITHNDDRALIIGYKWTGDGKTWGGVEAYYFASNGSKQTAYTSEVEIAV